MEIPLIVSTIIAAAALMEEPAVGAPRERTSSAGSGALNEEMCLDVATASKDD